MPPSSEDFSSLSQQSEKSNTILFDVSKNELFRITDNYKTLQRKLKGMNYEYFHDMSMYTDSSGPPGKQPWLWGLRGTRKLQQMLDKNFK